MDNNKHLYKWWWDLRSRCEVLLLLPGALEVVKNGKPHLAYYGTAWQLQIGLCVLISVVSDVLRLALSHLGHIAQGYYRWFFIYVSGLVLPLCNYREIAELSVSVSCSQSQKDDVKKWRLIPVRKPEPQGLRGGRFRERERREDCLCPHMSFGGLDAQWMRCHSVKLLLDKGISGVFMC